MFNILVTGANGQLGSELKEICDNYKYKFFFTCKKELDIANELDVSSFINNNDINVIINCAAYTAVDNAQDDEKNANIINHVAVKNIAKICKEKDIKLVHISTDYVFDGKHYKPYIETDITNPTSIYGKTKLKGEIALQKINPKNSIIMRTSWLYSSFGNNFVKTMLNLGKNKEEIEVVFDQIGTPTYAAHLADAILQILPKIKNEQTEIYHYSNEGVLSWYDFAKEIMKMTKLTCRVNPTLSVNFPRPAPRPYFSVLDKSKIKNDFDLTIPYWKDGLHECLIKMGEKK